MTETFASSLVCIVHCSQVIASAGTSVSAVRSQSCRSLQEEEEEEEDEAPRSRSRREAEIAQEEDEEFDDDDEEHMTEAGDFRCSTVSADGLPKGAGIPTEVITELMALACLLHGSTSPWVVMLTLLALPSQ